MKAYYCNGRHALCDRDHTKDCDGCEHADWTGGEYREVDEASTAEKNPSIDERIKYAEGKRDEAFSDGTVKDLAYWNGYIDALKAVKEEIKR